MNASTKFIKGDENFKIEGDWYNDTIPNNIFLEENVYIGSSFSFKMYNSKKEIGMHVGRGAGCYDGAELIVGKNGYVSIKDFTIFKGTIISNESVKIGKYCQISWGSIITDTYFNAGLQKLNLSKFNQTDRVTLKFCDPKPVVLEDGAWVGFESVILPGVKLGRMCIVGCKTVIKSDVPPYAIIAGNPPKIIRYLEPDDANESRLKEAMKLFSYK